MTSRTEDFKMFEKHPVSGANSGDIKQNGNG